MGRKKLIQELDTPLEDIQCHFCKTNVKKDIQKRTHFYRLIHLRIDGALRSLRVCYDCYEEHKGESLW